jgi:predicted ATPase/class 3 adenylate cyclase
VSEGVHSPAAAALAAAIAALEAQRGLLGDAVVDAALAPLRAQWAALVAAGAQAPAASPGAAPITGQAVPPAQSLRLVSVLFMDIVGSTSLTQRLDPEQVHEIMDGALERFTVLVQKRSGKVLQYAGDNLLAAFGAEGAREDDAEQAVRAGLDIIEAAQAEATSVLRQHGHEGFNVRVGVHTGSVLLGGGVDAEGSIRGMTVNVAARMEQTAPAGSLRISRDTWHHVRGLFALSEQPAIQVKGRDEPIVTYLVHGTVAKTFAPQTRGVEGLHTPLVGRESELAALIGAWQQVQADGRPRLVNIVADVGLGKSRLLDEFAHWQAERADVAPVWRARAQPAMQAQPYAFLRECLSDALGLAEQASRTAAQSAWSAAVRPRLHAAGAAPSATQAACEVLGHLLGIGFDDSPFVRELLDDERQRRQRGFGAARELFEALAGAHRPLWLLEDLHWADVPSLEFFIEWRKQPRGGLGLCLATIRASLAERLPAWPLQADESAGVGQIELLALAAPAAQHLAQALLARLGDAPQALHELLVQRAEGNPFYMEEIVQMLIDDAAIVVEPGHWRLQPQRLVATKLPGTLVGVMQARLDSLPPAERAALQEASVLGLVFWDAALRALDDEAPRLLPRLDERSLLRPRPDADEAERHAYAFAYQVLHQVTYDTVLKRLRRELHEKAARWLAGVQSARAADHLAAAAQHFERAELPALAAQYHLRAAEHALQRYAQGIALDQSAQALRLAPEDALELRWHALLVQQRAQRLQGLKAQAAQSLLAMHAVAEQAGRDDWRAVVALRQSVIALTGGDAARGLSLCQQALRLALDTGQARTADAAAIALAGALRVLGRHDEALRCIDEALPRALAQGHRRAQAELYSVQASIHSELGRPWLAAQGFDASLRELRAVGDVNGECAALVNLGDAALRLGDAPAAQQHLAAALELIEQTGLLHLRAGSLCNLAAAQLLACETQASTATAQRALEVAQRTGDALMAAYAQMALAHARVSQGDWPAAAQAYGASASSLSALELPHLAMEARAGWALAAAQLGDAATALEHLDAALAQAESPAGLSGTEQPLRMRWQLLQALRLLGDARAAPWAQASRRAVREAAAQLPAGAAQERFLGASDWVRGLMSA